MSSYRPLAMPHRYCHCAGPTYGVRWLLALALTIPGVSMAEIRLAESGQPPSISNGVPVINIANPNGKGLSHNRFEQFSVGKPGVIFNNSLVAGQSTLGGRLDGNSNLSHTAKAILTEVTGNQPSTLEGTLEVFGDRADIIVANPNGITLNGVKTLNTRGFVASTGTPDLDDSLSLNVSNGARVVVDTGGVDTQGLSYFDIVARTVALNGTVGATGASADVMILAGENHYDSEQRTYERLYSSGESKPDVAIEGGIAGAMHGGNITLISSESGVGVRHAGLISAAQDIRIQANGDIELSSANAAHDVVLNSTANVTTKGATASAGIQAAGNIEIKAEHIQLGAATQSNRFSAQAKSLTLNGTTLKTSANDPGTVALSINVEDLMLVGSLVAYGAPQHVVIRDGILQIRNPMSGRYTANVQLASTARIESDGGIYINAQRIHNSEGVIENRGDQELRIVADTLTNQGMMHSSGVIDITSKELNNLCINAQTQTLCTGIQSNTALSIKTDELNNQGGLTAGRDMILQLGHGQHSNGRYAEIKAGNDLLITRRAPGITSNLSNSGTIKAGNKARIIQNEFTNQIAGGLAAAGDLQLQAYTAFTNDSVVSAGGKMDISGQRIQINSGSALYSKGNLTLNAGAGFTSAKTAVINSKGDVAITSGTDLDNNAQVDTTGDLVMHAGGSLTNTGSIIASGNVEVRSEGTFTNKNNAVILGNTLTVTAKQDIINSAGSVLTSNQELLLASQGTLLNDESSLIEGGSVILDTAILLNQMNAIISGWDSLQINATRSRRNTTGASLIVGGKTVEQAEPSGTTL